ncbi:unnamed protein product [Brugia timori]|uniref:Uncharacterized protein n=1 Tax=Brugia timori TaxID=42155 RepID=A0A3P7VE12_9BILA|nr:unnamed protein product [Brugia timori]
MLMQSVTKKSQIILWYTKAKIECCTNLIKLLKFLHHVLTYQNTLHVLPLDQHNLVTI